MRMAMITANFTGGEAEELRRAMGFKRSQARMKVIEEKLRAGMTRNGICGETQEQIIQSITSFALYGFPESHSASFALIAYASAFLKVRYLAAFTAALLNNQPMGFYSPATLVKDAQRHGLKVRPIDVNCSEWNCTLENEENTATCSTLIASARQVSGHDVSRAVKMPSSPGALAPAKAIALRIGLRYVRGLQQAAAEALIEERRQRPFTSTEDLALRVPQLSRANLAMLARIGALNHINPNTEMHRRDALWQIEKAARKVGPLLENVIEPDAASPLRKMEIEERLVADYHGTGMTVGPHPMAYQRSALRRMGILSAAELRESPHGKQAVVAGSVITRQRPGTAKGLIFITLEDETGNSNIIVMPDLYSSDPLVVLHERFLKVKGVVQNQDGIVHLKAQKIMPLKVTAAEMQSHDFH